MTQVCQQTSRISIIFLIFFDMVQNISKTIHFFHVFSLGDFTFSITAQKRFGLLENRKRMNYDDLPFMRYIIDYCGASSSPDHSTQTLVKFRKDVFSFNGDVMHVIAY